MGKLYRPSFDAETQVDLEEEIAALIFEREECDVDEETANELGREILLRVVCALRPDLVEPKRSR